jgi:hypothetical protein
MAKQHVAILKALGIPQKDIDAIESLTDDLKDWTPDATIESIRSSVKKVLENDPDFLNSIPEDKIPEPIRKKYESTQYSRFQNELLDAAKKQLGFEDKDLEQLTAEDRKSIKKTMVKIADLHLGKKNNTEGLKKLQDDYQEALQQLEKKDKDWQTKLDTEVKTVSAGNTDKLVKYLAQTNLATLDKIKLNVPASYIVDPILGKLRAKYSVVLEGDDLVLRQKENPALKVVDKKNGHELSFTEALRAQVLEDKVGAEETKEAAAERKRVTVDTSEGHQEGVIQTPDYIKNRMEEIKSQEAATTVTDK